MMPDYSSSHFKCWNKDNYLLLSKIPFPDQLLPETYWELKEKIEVSLKSRKER